MHSHGTVLPWPFLGYFISSMAGARESYGGYQRTLADLSTGAMQPLYFGQGSDYYLYQRFLKSLRSAFKAKYGPNGDLVQRWGVDLKSPADVMSLLGGGGLFSSASLILLHEIQDASSPVKTRLADMLSSLPPDTTVLVHYPQEEKWKPAKWLEALTHAGHKVSLNQPDLDELPPIVQELSGSYGLSMDPAATLRLIELSRGELAIIDNELEKITLYLAEDQRQVSREIVDTVAGSIENAQVAQFVEAVTRRDRKLAMQTLVEIQNQGKEGLPFLVTMLYGRLIQLMALRETPEARKTINREGTSQYVLNQLGALPKNYSLPELQKATQHLAELDIGFRLGSVDLLTSFSSWVTKVL